MKYVTLASVFYYNTQIYDRITYRTVYDTSWSQSHSVGAEKKTHTKKVVYIHMIHYVFHTSLYENMFQGKVIHHFANDNVWRNLDVDSTRHWQILFLVLQFFKWNVWETLL